MVTQYFLYPRNRFGLTTSVTGQLSHDTSVHNRVVCKVLFDLGVFPHISQYFR